MVESFSPSLELLPPPGLLRFPFLVPGDIGTLISFDARDEEVLSSIGVDAALSEVDSAILLISFVDFKRAVQERYRLALSVRFGFVTVHSAVQSSCTRGSFASLVCF